MFDIDQFIADQLKSWPMVEANFAALDHVLTKQFHVGNANVVVQCNPKRSGSTNAKTDKTSIAARPCFLCAKNRPQEQKVVQWNDFEILVNPFPIFRKHLTIVLNSHEPQHLMPYIADMFRLAKLMPSMAVFFNGAKCGASAPDHMHFQAGNADQWPLMADFEKFPQSTCAFSDGKATTAHGMGRKVYKLRSASADEAQNLVASALADAKVDDEMINVIACASGDGVNIYVVPRRAFRPWQYSAEVSQRLLVSPAAAEVGGLIVTPSVEDFEKISAADVADIYRQVCFDDI